MPATEIKNLFKYLNLIVEKQRYRSFLVLFPTTIHG